MSESDGVVIKGGDRVISAGVGFHIKHATENTIVYWSEDDGRTYREKDEVFYDRMRQRGGFILEPGEGKFEVTDEWDQRERSVHLTNN
jgi:hypothetical protein